MEKHNATKHELRAAARTARKKISGRRRIAAALGASVFFREECRNYSCVLSYASFSSEIDTIKINEFLCREGKLILPRIDGKELKLHRVRNIQQELTKNYFGILEPVAGLCAEVEKEEISLALVPGLLFDADGSRLGYGGGFYDRLLSALPENAQIFGMGFSEQFYRERLPKMPFDFAVKHLALF